MALSKAVQRPRYRQVEAGGSPGPPCELRAVSLPLCSILCLHTQPFSIPTLVFHVLYFFLHTHFSPQLDCSLLGSRRPPSFLESPTEPGTALHLLGGLGNTG